MHVRIFVAGIMLMLATACVSDEVDETTGAAAGQAEPVDSATPPPAPPSETVRQPEPLPQDRAQTVLLDVGDRVFFGFDSHTLTPRAQDALQRQAAFLSQYPGLTVTIEGHCDERGTRDYNLALGESRAYAVKDYLAALGIDPNRIGTISYGKERPAVEGFGEAAWAQNRRAVTVIN